MVLAASAACNTEDQPPPGVALPTAGEWATPAQTTTPDAASPRHEVCGGDDSCEVFIALLAEFEAINETLVAHGKSGEYGSEDLNPARKAVELAGQMKAIACKPRFPIEGACHDVKPILGEARTTLKASERAYVVAVRNCPRAGWLMA